MAPTEQRGEALSHLLSHPAPDSAPASPPGPTPAALADALLAQAQREPDPERARGLVNAARILLGAS
jgi:hypothetical protein